VIRLSNLSNPAGLTTFLHLAACKGCGEVKRDTRGVALPSLVEPAIDAGTFDDAPGLPHALGDDFRTLPMSLIVADLPQFNHLLSV